MRPKAILVFFIFFLLARGSVFAESTPSVREPASTEGVAVNREEARNLLEAIRTNNETFNAEYDYYTDDFKLLGNSTIHAHFYDYSIALTNDKKGFVATAKPTETGRREGLMETWSLDNKGNLCRCMKIE